MIVGLIGEAGCGKTTFAAGFVGAANGRAVIISFADALKELCSEQFGWDRWALDLDSAASVQGYRSALDYKEAESPGTGWTRRQILQHVGTEGFRAIDPEHWVRKTRERMHKAVRSGLHVVVPDVRFLNEVAAIRIIGGVIVLLEREGNTRTTSSTAHASEQEWRQARADFEFRFPDGVEYVKAGARGFFRKMIS